MFRPETRQSQVNQEFELTEKQTRALSQVPSTCQ